MAADRDVVVDVSAWFDNRGITTTAARAAGAFNIWGNTLPAADLPAVGGIVRRAGVRFAFPRRGPGGCDNFRCAGQYVPLPPGRYDWLWLVAAAERQSEDEVWLHFDDGSVDPEWLRVSDFWPQTPPAFGEEPAARCTSMHYPRHVQPAVDPTLWCQRVPVTRRVPLRAVRFPDNPAIHVFALTALTAHPAGVR